MEAFKRCVESGECGHDEVQEVLARWPWFEAARALSGDAVMQGCSSLRLRKVEKSLLSRPGQGEIIDRFLRLDDYRIVASEEGDDVMPQTEAELDDEDDLVSEELAEVYLQQGLREEAAEIYRKLSLLNPEKSVYFVRKIDEIK